MSQTAPSASPKRRRLLWVAVALLVVLAVGLPTWGWQSAVASAQVQVVPGTMTCDGKAVPIAVPSEDEPGPPEYVIPIEKGMTCQFTVTVINHSGHAVRVKDMTFPALMPGHGNAGPMIVTGNDSSQKPHGRDGDLAATFDVDETVPPDESIGVELRLLTNPNACNSPGTAGLGDLPSTRIVVLHRQLTVHGQMAIAVKIKKALDGPTCASSS